MIIAAAVVTNSLGLPTAPEPTGARALNAAVRLRWPDATTKQVRAAFELAASISWGAAVLSRAERGDLQAAGTASDPRALIAFLVLGKFRDRLEAFTLGKRRWDHLPDAQYNRAVGTAADLMAAADKIGVWLPERSADLQDPGATLSDQRDEVVMQASLARAGLL